MTTPRMQYSLPPAEKNKDASDFRPYISIFTYMIVNKLGRNRENWYLDLTDIFVRCWLKVEYTALGKNIFGITR